MRTLSQSIPFIWLLLPILFLILSIVLVVVNRHSKGTIKLIFLPVIASLSIFCMLYSALIPDFMLSCNDDILVSVPDSDTELVIKEWYDLYGTGAFIYIKKDVGKELVCQIYGIRDNYCYFENGDYEIINNHNGTATVTIRDRSSSKEISRIFNIDVEETK